MKRRMVALLLGTAMVVASLAGCGSKETAESKESSKAEEKTSEVKEEKEEESKEEDTDGGIPVDYFAGTELDIVVARWEGDTTEDFNEKPIIKLAEEATGIKINWTIIDQAVQGERISTLLASQELPDAFLGGLMYSDTISQNIDMFYDLSKDGLLETYAPKVLQDYEDGGQGVLEMLTYPDGSIRSLAGNISVSYTSDAYGLWWINQKWLDAVGMDMPTTAEEFYEVLCAFRDQDPNGNGEADEIPMSFADNDWAAPFHQYTGPWGFGAHNGNRLYSYFKVEDGKVLSTVDTQAYRDYLEYFHMLAEEGLLDVEGFSQSAEQYDTKQREDKIGVCLEWTLPSEVQEQFVAMRPFTVEGYEPILAGGKNQFTGSDNSLIISANTENVEAILHWWNFLHQDLETKLTARMGVEGDVWYWVEEGTSWALYGEDEKPAHLDPNIDYSKIQTLVNVGGPYMTPDESKNVNKNPNYRFIQMNNVWDMLLDEYMPVRQVAPEDMEERSFIEADLNSLIAGFTSNSVVSGIDDASWDAFLKDLETYQYAEWIEWWQKYYDSSF